MRPSTTFRRPGKLWQWALGAVAVLALGGVAILVMVGGDRVQADPEKVKELAKSDLKQADATVSNDWPQWRGPRRDGVSTEKGLRTDWPKDGLPILWEQPVGDGLSSVAVAKGRVFTITQDGDNEAVVCWDEATGKELWRFAYAARYLNSYGNGPRATPTVDGDLVYTLGGTGVLHCLRALTDNPKGEIVWRKNLLLEFGAENLKWGVSFSPLADGPLLFLMPGGPGGKALAALDKASGAVVWSRFDDLPSYSSPLAATFAGDKQILFLTASRLVAVRPATGDLVWEHPWPIDFQANIATPIVVEEYIFLSSGYGKGCAVLKIEKTNDTWKPALVYKNKRMKNHFSTSVRWQDHVYGFDDGTFVCMDFRTGDVKWKERGFDKGSLAAADGHLVVYGENGVLALVEATPDAYREKARFQASPQGRSCWAVPVFANGRLYVRDTQKLRCFDAKAK